jgi:gag-polypeptide of LTR copia-type/Zinc knuckle
VWHILQEVHEGAGWAQQIALCWTLFTTQFDPTINTLHTHLHSLEEMTDTLEACRIDICEDLKIITLFTSLPSEYDPSLTTIISSLEVTGRDPSLIHSKTKFVTNLLLSEESQHIKIWGEKAPQETASQAIPWPHRKQLCYICQSPDHYQANCPTAAKPNKTAQMHQDLPNSEEIEY